VHSHRHSLKITFNVEIVYLWLFYIFNVFKWYFYQLLPEKSAFLLI